MIYPSWRYHATKPARLVSAAAEDEALGQGWADTPAAFERKRKEKSEKREEPPAE